MSRYRNTSADTVLDFLTQQVAEPDGVITVDDSLDENYENHPVWDAVPDTTKSRKDADR